MVFCYLNSACALLISCLFRLELNSFAIPAVGHQWNIEEKARVCRNAALFYLAVALYLTYKSMQSGETGGSGEHTRLERMHSFDVDPANDAAIPLLRRRPPAVPQFAWETGFGGTPPNGRQPARYGTL